MSSHPLRTALLDLGLEDWIPIPEAMADPEVVAAASGEDAAKVVAEALGELVSEGEVQLYRGAWDGDSEPVSTLEALRLLKEQRWYSFRIADPHEERLYFVNVRNIRIP